jgi:nitrite reductase (NADH) small subunit
MASATSPDREYMLAAEEPRSTLVKIATISELPSQGRVKEFMASGRMLCVANLDGEICAVDNACPHWGGPLGQGMIDQGKIACPWHGWRFDPRTGRGPAKCKGRLGAYRVKIEGDEVFVELDTAKADSPAIGTKA